MKKCKPPNKLCKGKGGGRCIPPDMKCATEEETTQKTPSKQKVTPSKQKVTPDGQVNVDALSAEEKENLKKGLIHSPAAKAILLAVGVTVATVGTITIVDLAHSMGSQTLEGGVDFDDLKPGDVVRKPCVVDGMVVAHYAVVSGTKINNKGEKVLTVFEVSGSREIEDEKEKTYNRVSLQERKLVGDKDISKWEKVQPPEGMSKQFGDDAKMYNKLFKKAKIAVGTTDNTKRQMLDYSLTGISCETFASMIAYGVPYSSQADFTNPILRMTLDNLAEGRKDRETWLKQMDISSLLGSDDIGEHTLAVDIASAHKALGMTKNPNKAKVMKGVIQSSLQNLADVPTWTLGLQRIGRSAVGMGSMSFASQLRKSIGLPGKLDDKIDKTEVNSKMHQPLVDLYNFLQEKGYLYSD